MLSKALFYMSRIFSLVIWNFFQLISERIKTTLEIETSSVEIEERGVKLKLTVVDTPGFADSLDCSDRWKWFFVIRRVQSCARQKFTQMYILERLFKVMQTFLFKWNVCDQFRFYFNPLWANTTKWSNTLKQFVSKSRWINWVCLTIFGGWHLKS